MDGNSLIVSYSVTTHVVFSFPASSVIKVPSMSTYAHIAHLFSITIITLQAGTMAQITILKLNIFITVQEGIIHTLKHNIVGAHSYLFNNVS